MKTLVLNETPYSKTTLTSNQLTRKLTSSILIHTSSEKAWDVIMDSSNWKQWNTFITNIRGDITVGNTISIIVNSPGMKPMSFKPQIFEVTSPAKLSWGGKAVYIGYKGVHDFIIEEVNNTTIRFTQIEEFQGPIVLLMKKMILKTSQGYEKMNLEFKAFLEEGITI